MARRRDRRNSRDMRSRRDYRRSMRDMQRRSQRTGRYIQDREGVYYGNDRNYGYSDRQSSGGYNGGSYTQGDFANYGGNSQYRGQSNMDMHYPFMMSPYGDFASSRGRGRDRRDRGEDFGEGEYLTDEELMEWSKELLDEVDEPYKSYFTKDNFERKMQEMGIQEKEFSFSELYTVALMLFDDYKKTLGMGNLDIYIKLAKDWLEDEDAELQGSEKLSAYYDNIVCADDD